MNAVCSEFHNNLVILHSIRYGRQLVYRFSNSYGLSIIEGFEGQGPRYNVAVVKFDVADNDYDVDYNTGIANVDVQTDSIEVVNHLLELVKNL